MLVSLFGAEVHDETTNRSTKEKRKRREDLHDTVGGPIRDHIKRKEDVKEDTLNGGDEGTFKEGRLRDLHPGEEMHALVLGLVQQMGDPAAVVAAPAERSQVTEHACYHSRLFWLD